MENNNYNAQQQYYQQPVQQPQYVYQQPNDPAYLAAANEYLRNAIISCCISALPIGSIIAIFMAKKYRKQLLHIHDPDHIGLLRSFIHAVGLIAVKERQQVDIGRKRQLNRPVIRRKT